MCIAARAAVCRALWGTTTEAKFALPSSTVHPKVRPTSDFLHIFPRSFDCIGLAFHP